LAKEWLHDAHIRVVDIAFSISRELHESKKINHNKGEVPEKKKR